MSNHLTLHLIYAIPFSNLNRDDAGVPKRTMQGGVLRAMHSSQSIKRGIRLRYEEASGNISIRSGKLAEEIVAKAIELNPDLAEKSALKEAKKIVGSLTKSSTSENESDRSTWLSQEELLTAATHVAGLADSGEDFINGHMTGSLAIAAFGRMFANSPANQTEAALSVSPAITTHAATIDTDYFSTVDDIRERNRETGATFLGISQYTSGVFYRTVTIDKKQLRESWSGFGSEDSADNLKALMRAVIYGQPRGKENSTAPYVLPALVLGEEQRYRTAYDFEVPVPATEDGGFLSASVDRIAQQYELARSFDPGNFGPVEVLSGTFPGLQGAIGSLSPVTLDVFIDEVTDWILND